jgi:hypothetical protein
MRETSSSVSGQYDTGRIITPSQPTSCACFDSEMQADVVRTGADDDGRAARDMLGHSGGGGLHLFVTKGAVTPGAAENADAVDAIIDLKIDLFEEAL